MTKPVPEARAVLEALRPELAEAGEAENLEPGPSPHEPLIASQESDVTEELDLGVTEIASNASDLFASMPPIEA